MARHVQAGVAVATFLQVQQHRVVAAHDEISGVAAVRKLAWDCTSASNATSGWAASISDLRCAGGGNICNEASARTMASSSRGSRAFRPSISSTNNAPRGNQRDGDTTECS